MNVASIKNPRTMPANIFVCFRKTNEENNPTKADWRMLDKDFRNDPWIDGAMVLDVY